MFAYLRKIADERKQKESLEQTTTNLECFSLNLLLLKTPTMGSEAQEVHFTLQVPYNI